jgi:hypothetical protein
LWSCISNSLGKYRLRRFVRNVSNNSWVLRAHCSFVNLLMFSDTER